MSSSFILPCVHTTLLSIMNHALSAVTIHTFIPPRSTETSVFNVYCDWLVSLSLCNSDNESQCACCQAVLYVFSSRHVTGSCSILNDQLKSVIMMSQGAVTIWCAVWVLWFLDGHTHVDQATTKAVCSVFGETCRSIQTVAQCCKCWSVLNAPLVWALYTHEGCPSGIGGGGIGVTLCPHP